MNPYTACQRRGGQWVTVLKQDTDDALFAPDEFRKNAHGGAARETTFAILDELEGMRRLSDGIALRLLFTEIVWHCLVVTCLPLSEQHHVPSTTTATAPGLY